MIVDSKDARANNRVGGKARSLSLLASHGFSPPEFFVVLPEAFSGGEPHPALEEELSNAIHKLGAGPFAVRSSGSAEDGAEHSHAGQFDTFLNVEASGVMDAACKVWQSGFSDRVSTYTHLKSGGELEPPAIVVQKMVPALFSGIVFSADPVSGIRNRTVISATGGYGDALVSGEVDGQSWIVEGDSIISSPESKPLLTHDQVNEIAALAHRAEDQFGHPQDVEWAIDHNGLHILQSRAITTELKAAPNPDTNLTILDNSNIVESYPGMVSPLTYSFAVHVYSRVYRAFVQLLGVSDAVVSANGALFDNMLARKDGRVYYNLVNWYRALALLPGFSLNRSYMETMMGVSEPLPLEVVDSIGPPPATGFNKLREYGRVCRTGAGLVVAAIKLPRTKRAFYKRLNQALNSGLNLEQAGPTEIAREYRRIESELLDRWDAPLVNDFLCMIAFGASRNLLEKWLGEDGLTLHNDVMIGQGDIVSAEPAQRIMEMGALARKAGVDLSTDGLLNIRSDQKLSDAFDNYLEKFSDRCTEELKLESITLDEDPTPLVMAVAASSARKFENTEPPTTDWDALFESRPIRKFIAKRVASWTKARVRDRENLRFERTRVFGYARRLFLALGREFAASGAIENTRDIFYLTKDEVLGAVEGFGLSPDLKGIVSLRKSEDSASASRPDPEERIEVRGAVSLSAVHSAAAGSSDATIESGSERQGTGCSAGTVTAKARVIKDPKTQSLNPGDILVARHTDPGWIAVFSNASAIVVERGSLLSHSAIVARELGIPCVVGLKQATQWIDDAEILEVNGGSGLVRKIDASS